MQQLPSQQEMQVSQGENRRRRPEIGRRKSKNIRRKPEMRRRNLNNSRRKSGIGRRRMKLAVAG